MFVKLGSNEAIRVAVAYEEHGMININLNTKVLKHIYEVYYWERLSYEIPHHCNEVFAKKDEIQNMRESVLTIVRDYNR